MRCDEAAERITALLDGELPPAERREVEEHLASCAACREAREAEEAVAARLRALPRPSLPEGFAAGVMGKVRAAEAPAPVRAPGRILPMWPDFAAAGAVAAAILAMVVVGPGRKGAAVEVALRAKPPESAAGPPPPAAPAVPVPKEGREAGALPKDAADDAATFGVTESPESDEGAGAPDARAEGEKQGRDDSRAHAKQEEAPPASAEAKSAAGEAPEPEESRGRARKARADAAVPAATARADAPGGVERPAPVTAPAPAPAPPAAEPADAGTRPGLAARAAPAAAAKPEPPLPRATLFYRVADLREGQEAVERALYAQKGLALARNPWRPAAELTGTNYGRLRMQIEREVAARKAAEPLLPEDRVLELRVRTEDLPRVRAMLAKVPPLRSGADLPIDGTAESLPSEILVAARSIQAVMDNSGLAFGGRPESGAGGTGGGGGAGADKEREGYGVGDERAQRDAGKPPDLEGRDPGEPQAPPTLSADGLRRLEDAPRPPSPSGLASASGSTEIWVEIHLLVVPPVARPPK